MPANGRSTIFGGLLREAALLHQPSLSLIIQGK
jgi:hypothetical protein